MISLTSWPISCAGTGWAPTFWSGICLERSPELVIGVLAILKSGGAFVPTRAVVPGSAVERVSVGNPATRPDHGVATLIPPSQ